MYSFSCLEPSVVPCPVLTVASWPTYRLLMRQVKWSGIPISWRIFHTQIVVIHRVKGFDVVSTVEVHVFLELFCFFDYKWMLAIWSLVPLPFLNPAWTCRSSWFTYCWSLAWRILSITLLAWDECNCAVVWAFFGIAFLWDWNENWPFPVLWPLLSYPICWHIECITFTASSFRIWNTSTGILSPPLALFIVMLPKAHLTLHSGMSCHSRHSWNVWL